VVDSSLEKVNDVKMTQSFFGRLFDYGDVEILTASEIGVNLFKRIGDPIKFKTAMLNAKEKLGYEGTGAHAKRAESIPEQIAELDQLRKQGIVTDAEFQAKKKELLAKM
jgi:predicted Zn-dependent peptidase